MSNPSRFDNVNLLSGPAGRLLSDGCLRPELNLNMCDVRLADDMSPLLEGTKVIVTLGEYATHKWIPVTNGNSIGEIRGGLYSINNIPAIPTFTIQDACDYKAFETSLNPLSKDYVVSAEEGADEDGEEDEGDVKRHGRTKRSNYFFWIKRDLWKAKQLLKGFVPPKNDTIYITYPSL